MPKAKNSTFGNKNISKLISQLFLELQVLKLHLWFLLPLITFFAGVTWEVFSLLSESRDQCHSFSEIPSWAHREEVDSFFMLLIELHCCPLRLPAPGDTHRHTLYSISPSRKLKKRGKRRRLVSSKAQSYVLSCPSCLTGLNISQWQSFVLHYR